MKLFFLWDLDKSKLKLMRGRQMVCLLRANPVPGQTREKPLLGVMKYSVMVGASERSTPYYWRVGSSI